CGVGIARRQRVNLRLQFGRNCKAGFFCGIKQLVLGMRLRKRKAIVVNKRIEARHGRGFGANCLRALANLPYFTLKVVAAASAATATTAAAAAGATCGEILNRYWRESGLRRL